MSPHVYHEGIYSGDQSQEDAQERKRGVLFILDCGSRLQLYVVVMMMSAPVCVVLVCECVE